MGASSSRTQTQQRDSEWENHSAIRERRYYDPSSSSERLSSIKEISSINTPPVGTPSYKSGQSKIIQRRFDRGDTAPSKSQTENSQLSKDSQIIQRRFDRNDTASSKNQTENSQLSKESKIIMRKFEKKSENGETEKDKVVLRKFKDEDESSLGPPDTIIIRKWDDDKKFTGQMSETEWSKIIMRKWDDIHNETSSSFGHKGWNDLQIEKNDFSLGQENQDPKKKKITPHDLLPYSLRFDIEKQQANYFTIPAKYYNRNEENATMNTTKTEETVPEEKKGFVADFSSLMTPDDPAEEYEAHKDYLSPEEQRVSVNIIESHPKEGECVNFQQLTTEEVTAVEAFYTSFENGYYAIATKNKKIYIYSRELMEIDSLMTSNNYSVCIKQFQERYLLSCEGIFVIVYHLTVDTDNRRKAVLRDHIDNVTNLLVLYDNKHFISGGKDRIMRMFDLQSQRSVRYYEGHEAPIKLIKYINNNINLGSVDVKNRIIIWDISNANMITMKDVYYTIVDIYSTFKGFVTGSYDNKIRFYNFDGNLTKCVITSWYNIGNLYDAPLEDKELLFTNCYNHIILYSREKNTAIKAFRDCTSKTLLLKRDLEYKKNKMFISMTIDGFIYTWKYKDKDKDNTTNA